MAQHLTAIVENGGLTLMEPIEGIPEHSLVRILIEIVTPLTTEEQLAMLREVPVSEELASEIEALVSTGFRGQVKHDLDRL